MARTFTVPHKVNYQSFINPNYAKVNEVNGWEIAKEFQAFEDRCLEQIPDEGAPKSSYLYNSHMGAFARSLDEAKDHFVKAKLAFFAEVNSGDSPSVDVSAEAK